MSTGIERTFRAITPYGAPITLYKEFLLHFIHYYDSDGSKLQTKLDKTIPGQIYREALTHEHSLDGEYTFTFQDGITRRLIATR